MFRKKIDINHHANLDMRAIKNCFLTCLKYHLAKDGYSASQRDYYLALAMTVRERIIDRWIETQQTYHRKKAKRVYYLSLEYLIGRSLCNNAINLNVLDPIKEALGNLGLNFEELREQEVDAGLGNGGLGRLAACFLDSMATLKLPVTGYGLRYDYGIFRQKIENNKQIEAPDEWLRHGNPWEVERPEATFPVKFGGTVETVNYNGNIKFVWKPSNIVLGVPFDTFIIGYNSNNVNNLRLWSAKASSEFDFSDFSQGEYIAAVEHKIRAENLTKVLYPNDDTQKGKELRFKQQYFFISCTLQDIIRRFVSDHGEDWDKFPDKVAIQLNDTHPSLAIPELMRFFIDEKSLGWDKAWDIIVKTFGYTNHTLLPEALEKWPVSMFKKLLPRHLDIIYEINRRFLNHVYELHTNNGNTSDEDKNSILSKVSLVQNQHICMGHLSVVGSHSTNGVAELHTELIKKNLFKDFYTVFPERFNCKTNGITQRRWLLKSNPLLAKWISDKIGQQWITNLDELKKLIPYTADVNACEEFAKIKLKNKENLAGIIAKETGVKVNPSAIFDVHIKRIHEYKRQLLNIFHIIMLYNKLKENSDLDIVPRVFIFGGKAAPGYVMAKLIIKLINCVAQVINDDASIQDKIKVVFLPNYRVSLAERIIPAADLSEQISTAGMEASGTGNMKLSLNGALTIGTLDGANIEILEEVGEENIFIFGLKAEEVLQQKTDNTYKPWEYYSNDMEIKKVIDQVGSDFFCKDRPDEFKPIINYLFHGYDADRFFVLADLRSYADCQQQVDLLYKNQKEWIKKAILNVANMGKFSSDRVIDQYAKEIWKVEPISVFIKSRYDTGRHQLKPQ